MANPTPFGRRLYAAITARGMSANQFAERVGMSSGFVSGVYSGTKRPPLERLERWAKVLHLGGDEQASFVLQAHLEHATPLLRRAFAQWAELAEQMPEAAMADERIAMLRRTVPPG